MSRKSHGISVFPRRRLLTSLVSFQARNSRHAQFPNGEFPIKGDTQRKVLPYGVWLCLCRRIEFLGCFCFLDGEHMPAWSRALHGAGTGSRTDPEASAI